jgi:hypothetical protein
VNGKVKGAELNNSQIGEVKVLNKETDAFTFNALQISCKSIDYIHITHWV